MYIIAEVLKLGFLQLDKAEVFRYLQMTIHGVISQRNPNLRSLTTDDLVRKHRKAAESLLVYLDPWFHDLVSETPVLSPWMANYGLPKPAEVVSEAIGQSGG